MKQKEPFHLPFAFGYGDHDPSNPNRIFRLNGSDCWVVDFIVTGRAVLHFEVAESLVLGSGDIFYYQAGVPQMYEIAPGASEWKHYWLCFTPSEKWLPWMKWKEYSPGFAYLSLAGNPELIRRLTRIFKEGIAVGKSHYPQRHAIMDNLIEQMILWLDMANPLNAYGGIDERVRRSLSHIDASMAQKLRIEDLARVAGLSPSRYAHLFRETMGLSPLHYLERRRIEHACELLKVTMDTVASIASRVGYEDPLYFSRVFRHIKGVPPSEYRSME